MSLGWLEGCEEEVIATIPPLSAKNSNELDYSR